MAKLKLKITEFYDYLDKMKATIDEKANARSTLIGGLAAYATDEAWKSVMTMVKEDLERKR